MDEAELVRCAQAGDEQSFARLLDACRAPLTTFIAARIPRSLNRKIMAEDVVQDACVTAYARLAGFEHRGDGAFRAWLFQIAQFKLQEAIRRFTGTVKRGAADELSRGFRRDTQQFEAGEGTPSEHAMARELRDRVELAMGRLSEDYRHVLSLVRVEQRSLREAALELDRGYEATKKLYGRAVAALAREIGHDAGSED